MVDLIDVVLVLVAAGVSLFLFSVVAISIAYYGHGAHPADARAIAMNAFVLVPAEAMAYAFTLGFAAYLVILRHGVGLLRATRWNMPGAQKALTALAGGAALGLTSQLLSGLLQRWIPKSLPIDQFFRDTGSAYLLAFFGILIAPLMEELFFRGFVYPAVARWTGVVPSVLITGGAFAMLHQGQLARAWVPLLILFAVGVVITAVRVRTRSVATCVFVHMGYNLAIFTLLFIITQGFRHMEKAS